MMEKESKYILGPSSTICWAVDDKTYSIGTYEHAKVFDVIQSEEARANRAEARNRELEAERDELRKGRDLARAERGIFLTERDAALARAEKVEQQQKTTEEQARRIESLEQGNALLMTARANDHDALIKAQHERDELRLLVRELFDRKGRDK